MGGAAEVGVDAGGIGLAGGRMCHYCCCRRCCQLCLLQVQEGAVRGGIVSGGGGAFSGPGRERGLVIKEALDELCQVFFVQCFLKPILY